MQLGLAFENRSLKQVARELLLMQESSWPDSQLFLKKLPNEEVKRKKRRMTKKKKKRRRRRRRRRAKAHGAVLKY